MLQIIFGTMALLGIALGAQVSMNIDLGLFDASAVLVTVFGTTFYFFLFFGQEAIADFIRLLRQSFSSRDFLSQQKHLAEWMVHYAWMKQKHHPAPDVPKHLRDDFLSEVLGHMERGILLPEMLREIMLKSAQTECNRAMVVREKLQMLANYLPTLCVLGMVLAALSKISGLYHPLALTATATIVKFATLTALYTFVLAFFVITPLAEKLYRDNEHRRQRYLLIIEGIYRIMRKENPFHILERLNALQPLNMRMRWNDLPFSKDEVSHAD